MDLLQLKMPPDRARIMADAIERDLEINRVGPEAAALRSILSWLRYRIDRFEVTHPDTPAA